MDIMESYVQGWWRPSPGSIYPLLESMKKEGVLSMSEDKRYSLTEKGREEIERPFPWVGREPMSPRSPEQVLEHLSSYLSYLEDLAHSDKDKLAQHADKIRELSERLAKVGSVS